MKNKNYLDTFTSSALGLVDREREARQLMYALLTREHMLMMGPAGTAKSLFAMNAFSAIDDAKTFQIHLTKQTTEEYVFGPLNIAELKRGNFIHNTDGSILDADFAFIDEFFDASDVLLRSLLGVLNERLWLKGSQRVQARLNTAIVTSNYQRENEITNAILDRIIFKCEIAPSTDRESRVRIYRNYLSQPSFIPTKILSRTQLEKITEQIESPNTVKFPPVILETYDKLLEEFTRESKKYISPRTANKALKVLKVSALMDNRDEVNYEDMEDLRYVFCVLNKRIEEEIFDAVFEKWVGKIEEEQSNLASLEKINSQLNLIPVNFDTLTDQQFVESMRQLEELVSILEKMSTPTQDVTTKRDILLSRIRGIIANNRDKLFKRRITA